MLLQCLPNRHPGRNPLIFRAALRLIGASGDISAIGWVSWGVQPSVVLHVVYRKNRNLRGVSGEPDDQSY